MLHKCDKCNKKFNHLSDFKRHLVITYLCIDASDCRELFENNNWPLYSGPRCNILFSKRSTDDRDIKGHNKTRDYICQQCQSLFSNAWTLKLSDLTVTPTDYTKKNK